MKDKKCGICGAEAVKIFDRTILDKYRIDYFRCPACDLVQTEEPYWLNEAYASTMNLSDTGLMLRNIFFPLVTLNLVYYYFDRRKVFLDYAGGYGIFVRLMRDIGLDFRWQDNFASNLLARGFEYSDRDAGIELITAFEVFEHFKAPLEEIEKMLKISKNILFSTTLLPCAAPKPEEWWYYGFDHGQHISFYSQKTFRFIAGKYGLNYYTDNRSIHLLTDKKISPLVFRSLAGKRSGLLPWIWAWLHLKSRTWDDHRLMSKNNAA